MKARQPALLAWVLAPFGALLAFASCTAINDTFCDERTLCREGFVCHMEQKRCLVDADPPSVRSRSPVGGATAAGIDTTVVIRFSEDLDPTTVSGESVELRRDGRLVGTVASHEGDRITLKPTELLEPDTEYTVVVSAQIADLAGNALGKESSWSFTTSSGPGVAATEPAADAVDVASDASIVVTFSEPVEPASVTAESFEVEAGDGAEVSGALTVDDARVVFEPGEPLEPDTLYVVTLLPSIVDLQGYALADERSWSFRTAARPKLVSITPEDGAAAVSRETSIELTFDVPLNESSIGPDSVQVVAGEQPVGGTLSLDPSGRTIIFHPDLPLGHNTTYRVTVSETIESEKGMPLGALAPWGFVTLDGLPPTVASSVPAQGAEDAPTEQIVFTFSEPIASAEAARPTVSVLVRPGEAAEKAVDGAVTVDGATVTFVPTIPLALGTPYVASISGAVDLSGNKLEQAMSLEFTTRWGGWHEGSGLLPPPKGSGWTQVGPLAGLDDEGRFLVVWTEVAEAAQRSVIAHARGNLWQGKKSLAQELDLGFDVSVGLSLATSNDGGALLVSAHPTDELAVWQHFGHALAPGRPAAAAERLDGANGPGDALTPSPWIEGVGSGGVIYAAITSRWDELPDARASKPVLRLDDDGWAPPIPLDGAPRLQSPAYQFVSDMIAVSPGQGSTAATPLAIWKRTVVVDSGFSSSLSFELRSTLVTGEKSPDEEVLSRANLDDHVKPAAAMNDVGDATVVWVEYASGSGLSLQLRARRYSGLEGGWGPAETLADSSAANQPFSDRPVRSIAAAVRNSGARRPAEGVVALVAWVAGSKSGDADDKLFVNWHAGTGGWFRNIEMDSGRDIGDVALLQDETDQLLLVWTKRQAGGSSYETWSTRLYGHSEQAPPNAVKAKVPELTESCGEDRPPQAVAMSRALGVALLVRQTCSGGLDTRVYR